MKVLGDLVTLLIGDEIINIKTTRKVELESNVVIAKKGMILLNLDVVNEDYRILNGEELGYEYLDLVILDSSINAGEDYFKNKI